VRLRFLVSDNRRRWECVRAAGLRSHCLRTLLDQYLHAVTKHDPAAAPLVVGFRQTENAVNVRTGIGVWKTVTGLGAMQRRYLDAVSGQAGYYGIVQEGADSAIVTVRIRVENGKLTEAEWYLARANDPGLNGRVSLGVRRRISSIPSTSGRIRRRSASFRCRSGCRARRFWRSPAVLAMAVFIRRPGSPTPRDVFSEWFFIDEEKIRTIYTAMFYPPPELAVPNWPPYEGHWPLPAGIQPTPAPPRE
jgi:hypothetical protein